MFLPKRAAWAVSATSASSGSRALSASSLQFVQADAASPRGFTQMLAAMPRNVAISVSKIDAAKRQLETALRLYFGSEDPITIHTLASAAFGILNDVSKSKELEVESFHDLMMKQTKLGQEKKMRFYLKRHENFFKHADRDSDANIDFNPSSTDWVLFDCIRLYCAITQENPPIMKAFHAWWLYSYKHLLKLELQGQLEQFAQHQEYLSSRGAFFSTVMPFFSRADGS